MSKFKRDLMVNIVTPPTSLNNQSIEHPIRTTVNYSRVIFPCFGYGIHVLLKIADNALLIFCKMSFFSLKE